MKFVYANVKGSNVDAISISAHMMSREALAPVKCFLLKLLKALRTAVCL